MRGAGNPVCVCMHVQYCISPSPYRLLTLPYLLSCWLQLYSIQLEPWWLIRKCNNQGLIQGGWIGCLVTPLWVTLSTRTIKHAIHSQGNRAKQDSKTVHMLSEFKGYGNTVGILAHCGGGGTSPFHAPLLNLVLVTPAAKFLDQPLIILLTVTRFVLYRVFSSINSPTSLINKW